MLLPHLPKDPGVYLFKNKEGVVLYVGKAKNLRNRVSSYFNKNQTEKTKSLIKNVHDVDYFVLRNEIEALLLENRLIKKHKPRYNIMLKDSKTYAYILLTDETYPRILTARKTTQKGTYFGPFIDARARDFLMQLTIKLFKLRVCKTLPKRACLNYHINLCTAPCIDVTDEQAYNKQVDAARIFLKGNTKPIVKKLTAEMHKASGNQQYEKALEKRNQIEAIAKLSEKQSVDLVKSINQDVIAFHTAEDEVLVVLFSVKKGVISGKRHFRYPLRKIIESPEEIYEKFLTLYYSSRVPPQEILTNSLLFHSTRKKHILEKYLSSQRNGHVRLLVPQRGEKKKLLDLAIKNAQISADHAVLREIQKKLTLSELPRIIECFDISNIGPEHVVGGMTRWVNALPDASGYRRFEIRSFKGKNDDFAAMREVIYRRYKRLQEHDMTMPNLIVIDGGLGQLHAALDSLRRLGLALPVISLAKKQEEIYVPGRTDPLQFNKTSDMMLLIRKIRDSVHRYSVTYNRKKREMRLREEIKAKK